MAKIITKLQNGKLELEASGTYGEILGLLAATEDAIITNIASSMGIEKEDLCAAYNRSVEDANGKRDTGDLDKILNPGRK